MESECALHAGLVDGKDRHTNIMKITNDLVNQVNDSSVTSQKGSCERQSGILSAFVRNRVALRSFISRFMISKHDIDDVSQETFLRAYKAEQNMQIDQPKAFLFRIAKNLMLSEFSKKSRKITDYIEDFEYSEVLLGEESLEANLMAQQKLGIFCEAVASLPPQCRRAVLMRKIYGMPVKEIARRLKISISTTEKHLTKGVRQCNAIIAERYDEADTHNPRLPNPNFNTSRDGRRDK